VLYTYFLMLYHTYIIAYYPKPLKNLALTVVTYLNIPAWQRPAASRYSSGCTAAHVPFRPQSLYGRATRGIGRGNGRDNNVFVNDYRGTPFAAPARRVNNLTCNVHINIILLLLLYLYRVSRGWRAVRRRRYHRGARVCDKAVSIISPIFISLTFDGGPNTAYC